MTMPPIEHDDLVEPKSIHPIEFYQEGDPGAIGAGKRWTVPSTGTRFRRNSANDGWNQITGPGLLFDSLLSADTATIDTGANGIAGGYRTLEIVIVGRTDEAVKSSVVALTFNGDSGTNYTRQYHGGLNVTASIGAGTADAGILFPLVGSTFLANAPSAWVVIIPSYAGTTFFKVADLTGGHSSTTAADSQAYHLSATWRNAAAINRATLSVVTAAKKLVAGARMTVYGR